MSEADWLVSGSRQQVWATINGRVHRPARWLAFNLACLDRIRDLIDDPRCLDYVRALEGLAADAGRRPPRWHDLEEAVRAAIRELPHRPDDSPRRARVAAARAVLVADLPGFSTSESVVTAVGRRTWGTFITRRDELCADAALLREVFGNPFRPVAFDPDWRTAAAVAVARSMYESRDFAPMPVLADALEDAGCDHPDIIGHCRGPGPHVRGCWVVDLVLGMA